MLFLIILSFLVYVGLMLAGVFIFGIIIAVLPDDGPPEIITFFALAQFPIFIMPSLTKPVVEWYLRGRNSMRM